MRARVVLALLAFALVLTGCASLPEAGSVSRGIDAAPQSEAISLVAEDPQPGDSAEQIVRGFLNGAAAGTADDYAVARRYLTSEASDSWNAGAAVGVYSGSNPLEITQVDDQTYTVGVTLSGTVDASGVYTPAPGASTTTVEFGLVEDANGQWRIDRLDNGVLVSEVIFGSQFRQIPLYFLTADSEMLVPDVRWYPQRTAPTSALHGLLGGPVSWLEGPVFSAIPGNTALADGSVTVSSGTASVDLTSEALSADAFARQLIRAQIEKTLLSLPQIQRVELTVDDMPWDSPVSGLEVDTEPSVGRSPVLWDVEEQLLGTFSGSASTPVNPLPDVVPTAGVDPGPVALSYGDEHPTVMLSGTSALITVPTEQDPEPRTVMTGPDLVAPSYDRHGWVWSGFEDSDAALYAARSTGDQDPVAVEAQMLAGAELIALRLSREGSRIALIYQVDGALTVEVAAVVRDDAGVPVAVTEGAQVTPQLIEASDVKWVDDQHLAILGLSTQNNTVHLTPVGGATRLLPSVPEAVQIAARRSEREYDRELYVITASGELHGRSGFGWRELADGVAFPAFAG